MSQLLRAFSGHETGSARSSGTRHSAKSATRATSDPKEQRPFVYDREKHRARKVSIKSIDRESDNLEPWRINRGERTVCIKRVNSDGQEERESVVAKVHVPLTIWVERWFGRYDTLWVQSQKQ